MPVDDDESDKLDSDEFNLSDVHHEPTKGKGKAIKVSPFFPLFFYLLVTSILKFTRIYKNPKKANSAEISTMPAPIQPSQEIPPSILLPK